MPPDEGSQPLGPVASWFASTRFSGDIEVGATMNPADPDTGINFGHLFTDKTNQFVLNQFALSAERTPDAARAFDLGFALQGMYGMDSQFTHYLGIGDHPTTNRNSFDFVEGALEAHARILTPRGMDMTLGFFTTPMGYEAIDPLASFFYSKSYIFNFGLPRKHTGLLTVTHVNSFLDLYLGYTTGANTSLGPGGGYNDGQPHILGGFALKFDRVSVKALTHVGPEDPPDALPPGVNPHTQPRYYNDVVINWRVNDKLTSITELNYIRDDGLNAWGGGASEYLIYPLSAIVTAGLRAEFWRDAQGVFVAGYPDNEDYLDREEGLPNGSFRAGPASYGALTLGLNIQPSGLPRMIAGLTVRPEVRYDRVLAGASAFGSQPGSSRDQVTIGADVVVPLSFPKERPGPAGEGLFITSTREPSGPAAAEGGAGSKGPSILRLAAAPAIETFPAAITLIGPGELDAVQPRTLEDLDGFAPNLQIGRTGVSPSSSAINIRGFGDSEPEGGRPTAVSLVVDGIVMGTNTGQLIDLYDVQRVTVERGPAGTFDAADAIGGEISVERARPTRQWGLQASYGLEQGYHTNIEQALLNVPIGVTADGTAAGLAVSVSHQQRGGYLNNIYTGDGLYGRDERTSGTLQFDWNVTSKFEALAEVTLTNQQGQGTPVALGDTLAASLLGPSLPGVRFNGYGSPYIPGTTQPLGLYQVANDFSEKGSLTSQVYSLNLGYDSPIGRFTSITGYVTQNSDTWQDLDGACGVSDLGGEPCGVLANPAVGFLHVSLPRYYTQFSEAFKFSHDFGSLATLTAGMFYLHNDASGVEQVRTATPDVPVGAVASSLVSREIYDSTAGYADLTVRPLPRLSLSAGLRYVDDATTFEQSSSLSYIPFIGPGYAPLTAGAGATSTSKVLTKFVIDYQLTDGSLLYAERTVGLRPAGAAPFATLSEQVPGQANYDPANPGANYSTFGAETTVSYEIGSKNTFFARQLTLNVAAFLNEDTNHQADEVVATPGYGPLTNTYVVNIPKVQIAGAELEAAWRPAWLQGLTLSGLGGYQDARITSGVVSGVEYPVNANATAGAPGTAFNLTGLPLERAPEFNAMLRADYARQVGGGLLDMNVGYRWTDRYALAQVAGQSDWQPAFGLVDLSLSFSRDFYRLSVAAKNLTGQAYFSNAIPALFAHGWGDPRTVVVSLAVGF
jgi:outer membrane receptor protein involved in Fe transport